MMMVEGAVRVELVRVVVALEVAGRLRESR